MQPEKRHPAACEAALARLKRKQSIAGEIGSVLDDLFAGALPEDEAKQLLRLLSEKGVDGAELTQAHEAMYERMGKGFPTPEHLKDRIIDTCGTGGDNLGTYNISTAVAFVAAGAGVPVTKHGNRSVSSKSGSSDVLTALGVNIEADEALMVKALEEHNICFLFAPRYHGYMKVVAPIRQALGIRTIFNALGPLVNPARPRRQLIGVYDKSLFHGMWDPLSNRAISVMIVHGACGEDEISVCGETLVFEPVAGRAVNEPVVITPEQFGLKRHKIDDLKGGKSLENAEALKEILRGNKARAAYYDAVLLNGAAALKVAGVAKSLEQGLRLAEQSITSGAALAALDGLVKVTNGA